MEDIGPTEMSENGLGYILKAIKTSPQIKSVAICNLHFDWLVADEMKTQDLSQCLLTLQRKGQDLDLLIGNTVYKHSQWAN